MSNFYLCKSCGYGVHDDVHYDAAIEQEHFKPDGYKCSNKKLYPYSLGHEFQTDVVLLKFISENIADPNVAWTVLYSLLEGLSRNLSIDRNELSGCLHWYRNKQFGDRGNFGFILFDNTPGGAGYVRQLHNLSTLKKMLEFGEGIVNNCQCGGKEANTACYSCLFNYYNQKQHEILKRRYAIDFFGSLKNGNATWYGNLLDSKV